jgi:hypothetical protein
MNVVWGTNVIPNNMTGTKVFQALSKLIFDVKIASTQKKMFASNATSYIVATMNINISQHVIIVEICFAKNTWKNLANMDGIAEDHVECHIPGRTHWLVRLNLILKLLFQHSRYIIIIINVVSHVIYFFLYLFLTLTQFSIFF